jgi:hypothetical protein
MSASAPAGFLSIYCLAFRRPAAAFGALRNHDAVLVRAFQFILVPIAGYTAMYVFLTLGHGAPSVFTPWLNISREAYYGWNRFLLAPSMLLGWWSATVLMHLLARAAGGKGTFEHTLAAIGLAISLAMLCGLLHDLPMSFLSAIGVIDARAHEIAMNSPTIFRTLLWIAYGAYAVAFGILFPLAVRVTHGLSVLPAIGIGIVGFAWFQVVFLVFNR